MPKRRFIEDQAEESDGEGGVVESDDEELDDEEEEDLRDFIVEEADEEENLEAARELHQKLKRRDVELSEEDLELLEEGLGGATFRRGEKHLKRLKRRRARDVESDADDEAEEAVFSSSRDTGRGLSSQAAPPAASSRKKQRTDMMDVALELQQAREIFGEDFSFGESFAGGDASQFAEIFGEDGVEEQPPVRQELLDPKVTELIGGDKASKILSADVPERLQERVTVRSRLAQAEGAQGDSIGAIERSLRMEAAWICRKYRHKTTVLEERNVEQVLRYIALENLEIGYIAKYKLDMIGLIDWDTLELINDADRLWLAMGLRRMELRDALRKFKPQSEQERRAPLSPEEEIAIVPDLTVDERRVLLDLIEHGGTEEELGDLSEFVFYRCVTKEDVIPGAALLRAQEGEASKRKSVRRGPWAMGVRAGLWRWASQLGLSAERLAYAIHYDTNVEPPRLASQRPDELMESVANEIAQIKGIERTYGKGTRVMTEAARRMVAHDLFLQPMLKKDLRSKLYRTTVTVRLINAAPKRNGVLANVPPLSLRRLRDLKEAREWIVMDLQQSPWTWLDLLKGEEDGKLRIDFRAETFFDGLYDNRMSLRERLYSYVTSREMSPMTAEWNNERKAVIDVAIQSFMKPFVLREARKLLNEAAMELIQNELKIAMRKALSVGPIPAPPVVAEGQEVSAALDELSRSIPLVSRARGYGTAFHARVAAFVPGPPIAMAMLDCFGAVEECLAIDLAIDKRRRYEIPTEDAAALQGGQVEFREFERLKKFIIQNGPQAIVLSATPGATGNGERSCKLREIIGQIVENAVEEKALLAKIPIYYMDEDPSRVFASARRGKAEFGDLSDELRTAISLGRRLQSPLREFALLTEGLGEAGEALVKSKTSPFGINTPEEPEVLRVTFHEYQNALSSVQRCRVIRDAFIWAVVENSVDINGVHRQSNDNIRALSTAACMLQFVPGLGPVRARHIAKKVVQAPLVTRTSLKDSISDTVFLNAAAFITVRDALLTAPLSYLAVNGYIYGKNDYDAETAFEEVYRFNPKVSEDPLDITRIHPEHYVIAWRIISTVLGLEPAETERDGRQQAISLFDKVLDGTSEHQNLQENLRVDRFADILQVLEEDGSERYTSILAMIVEELRAPWMMTMMTPYMNPSEPELFPLLTGLRETELVNSLTTVRVTGVKDNFVRVMTEFGIPGIIWKNDLSDEFANNSSRATCSDRVDVGDVIPAGILECAFFQGRPQLKLSTRTSYLSQLSKDLKAIDVATKKPTRSKTKIQKRGIRHDYFANMTYKQSQNHLKKLYPGSEVGAIIRPCSKGADFLNITFKVHDNVFLNVEIQEHDKPTDVPKHMTVGKKLTIQGETYEDLDEVLSRYIESVLMFYSKLKTHKKFFSGELADAERSLRIQKERDPKSIPYLLYFEVSTGKIRLAYLPNSTIYSKSISVGPDGYELEKKRTSNLDSIISHFKRLYAEECRKKKLEQRDQIPPKGSYRGYSAPSEGYYQRY